MSVPRPARRVAWPLALTILAFGLAIAGAGAQSTGGMTLSGLVTVEGRAAPDGWTVTALIGETACGTALVHRGAYALEVYSASTQPGCGIGGAPVHFRILNAPARESILFRSDARLTLHLSTGGPALAMASAPTPAVVAPLMPSPFVPAREVLEFSGRITIEEAPPPAGTRLSVRVGTRECVRIPLDGAEGRFRVRVPAGTDGCGEVGAPVQLAPVLPPPFPPDLLWEMMPTFELSADGLRDAALDLDLAGLPPDAGNVPLGPWRWAAGRVLLLSPECSALGDARVRVAGMHAVSMWLEAVARGLRQRMDVSPAACLSGAEGIVIRQVNEPEQRGAIVRVEAVGEDGAPCLPGVPCTVVSGQVVVNVADIATRDDPRLARAIARGIGRLLGLGSARRCTGGTIMHDDPRCDLPVTSIGVDDITTLNRALAP